MYKYLIIGAGITGISLARFLQMKGENNFLILESESEAGGLCRSKNINGYTLDIGGGHFWCSKFKEINDFVFSHIPVNNLNKFKRVSKIRMNERVIDYPLESNIWQLCIEDQIEYLISAIQNGEALGCAAPDNYESWIRWKLGSRIAESYMLPYNKKIWGVNPDEMDIDWLHKIPELNIKEIVMACIAKTSDESKMPSHAEFYYPQKGGFQSIFDALLDSVKNYVVLNEQVIDLKFTNGNWRINNKYFAKNVINTAPWPDLFEALGSPEELRQDFDKLKYNSIVVSLWEQSYNHDWHWIYDPNMNHEYHREFFINNFALDSKDNGLYTETNVKRWPGYNRIWSNNNKPIYEYLNKAAYPIPVIGHSQAITNILSYYKMLNLFGVGRWGQWQYLNSDVCIYEAMKFVRAIEVDQ